MMTLYLGDNPYTFPNRWEELNPNEYRALIGLIGRMWSGDISMLQLRVDFFKKLASLENIRVPLDKRERFLDNLVTAARQFDFFYKIDYAGKTDDLSPGIKKMLRKTPPDEINSENGEIRYARNLDYSYQIDAVWAKNLLPTIELRDQVLTGWTALVDGGALTTSLTSKQYTYGFDILSMISTGGGPKTISLLIALLYNVDINDLKMMEEIELLPYDIMQGVVLNFQAFVSFIFTKTPFSILWNSATENDNTSVKTAAAMNESLYTLCKQGYGDYNRIENMPLMTYLSITRTELINSIRSMKASGIKPDEIAVLTNLTLSQIHDILC